MDQKAFLLFRHKIHADGRLEIEGAGVYSEQTPSTVGTCLYSHYLTVHGRTFAKAREQIFRSLATRYHSRWLQPLLQGRDLEAYERALIEADILI